MATTTATRKTGTPAIGSLSPNTLLFILWVVGVAIVISVYYFIFYQPLDEERTREVAHKSELQTQRASVEQDLRTYNNDVAELARSREHAQELQNVLPPDADIPGFMRNINALAEASGLRISLIQPVEERTEQYYARIPVQLTVAGTYLGLARFFNAVSQLPRVINMENIKLATPTLDPTSNDTMLTANVMATTFRSTERPRSPAAANGARP